MVTLSTAGGAGDVTGNESDASGLLPQKNGYDMAIEESDDKLDVGVVIDADDSSETDAGSRPVVAARRRLLLDPLFLDGAASDRRASLPTPLGGVMNLASTSAASRSLLDDADADCDAVDVEGIGPQLRESRTTGFDELRELLPNATNTSQQHDATNKNSPKLSLMMLQHHLLDDGQFL